MDLSSQHSLHRKNLRRLRLLQLIALGEDIEL